jgi:hypothetical protein
MAAQEQSQRPQPRSLLQLMKEVWPRQTLPNPSHRRTKTFQEALIAWLDLYQRIVRSTGKIAQITRIAPETREQTTHTTPEADQITRIAPETREQTTHTTPEAEGQRPLCIQSGDRYFTLDLNRLGKDLLEALAYDWPSISSVEDNTRNIISTPEVRYSPKLNLLFESATERGLIELINEPYNNLVDIVRLSDIFNGCVEEVRDHAASARFREKQKEFVRIPHANDYWLRSFINDCFEVNE